MNPLKRTITRFFVLKDMKLDPDPQSLVCRNA
jgi:hypothetical protein